MKRQGKLIKDIREGQIKKAGQDASWIQNLVKRSERVADPKDSPDSLRMKAPEVKWGDGLCVDCKGGKFLCGKTRCPLVIRLKYYFKTLPLIQGNDIDGASPPSVFVGRFGYPHVYAGPLVPPIHEDTSSYDLPELWFGKSIDEIVAFRSMLVRGKHRVHVKRFEEAGRIMDRTRELALSESSVEAELLLKRRPTRKIALDDGVQPFGPSAPIHSLDVTSSRWNRHIEKAYGDTDLKAAEAVTKLHEKGVLISKIQRAFSIGAFGLKDNRRLVPTRWSITAVDSTISKKQMEQIKLFPQINEYRIYESQYLDNRFEVLMIPGAWSYEAMEAWYPGTIWNPGGRHTIMYSDWEGHKGRTKYAKIGGCYYAARLAVGELLTRERSQARVIVLREARPGYVMPVGVWQVRENVRNAMRQKPLKYDTLQEALARIASRFEIPLKHWIESSMLIQNTLFQRRITDYHQ